MKPFTPPTIKRLEEIIYKIKTVKAAIFGDLCIDVYWDIDMRMSELSRETPHFVMPVVGERISLGGGGNVAANLAALAPDCVLAAGLIGKDWRGHELTRIMKNLNIDISNIVCKEGLITNAFCKPMRRGISHIVYEDPRLDFANVTPFGKEAEDTLIKSLDALVGKVDILCVSDQLPTNVYGAVTEKVREHIHKLAAQGLKIVVDSRDKIGLYKGMILKPNEVEATRAVGMAAASSLDDFAKVALALSDRNKTEVIMTVGPEGALYASDGEVVHIPTCAVKGNIDIVGAGDSFISGFALALASGASPTEAAFFAGLCSGVTIQKIGTTGTASGEEVLKWYLNQRR
ncbi:MAG: PfkB family carbohydrate kinase [Defluviitaleaceae bacterium]|nr:PfkB family carbohydrate kinase [Defluviitaleaceae bacterium]